MRTEQDHVFKAEHTGPSTSRCLVNTRFFGSPRSGSPSDDHLAALQSFNCNERFELHEPEASAQAGTLTFQDAVELGHLALRGQAEIRAGHGGAVLFVTPWWGSFLHEA